MAGNEWLVLKISGKLTSKVGGIGGRWTIESGGRWEKLAPQTGASGNDNFTLQKSCITADFTKHSVDV